MGPTPSLFSMSGKFPNHGLLTRAAASSKKRVTILAKSQTHLAGAGPGANIAPITATSSAGIGGNGTQANAGSSGSQQASSSTMPLFSANVGSMPLVPRGAGAIYAQRTFHLWNASNYRSSAASYHSGPGSSSYAQSGTSSSASGSAASQLPRWMDTTACDSVTDFGSTSKQTFSYPTVQHTADPAPFELPSDVWTNADLAPLYTSHFQQPLLTWEQTNTPVIQLRDLSGGENGSSFTNPFGAGSGPGNNGGNGGFRPPVSVFDFSPQSSLPPDSGASFSSVSTSTSHGGSHGGSGAQAGASNASHHPQIGTISAYPMGPSASSSGAMASTVSHPSTAVFQRAEAPSKQLSPFMARAISTPRARKPEFTFDHGAYGIPKRHPLAGRPRVKKSASAGGSSGGGAMSMLSAAADFLTGPQVAVNQPQLTDEEFDAAAAAGVPPGHVMGVGKSRSGKNPEKLRLRENGKLVPDRLRSVQVGEDAYFLRPVSAENWASHLFNADWKLRQDALGVADGVGGWATRPGANAALYSRLLMHFCSVELSRYDALSRDDLAANNGELLEKWQRVDPVEVMHRAWERCVRAARKEGILGSSTALLAVLRGDELRIANLGDCVLLIIRDGDLLFRSTEQQHSFNFPVQLGMMGDTVEKITERIKAAALAKKAAERGQPLDATAESASSSAAEEMDSDEESLDDPESEARQRQRDETFASTINQVPTHDDIDDAEWDEPRRDAGRWTVKVQPGDIIILGSDGLVDNLFDEDILEEVLKFAPNHGANATAPSSDGNDTESVAGSEASEAESTHGRRRASGSVLPPDFSPQGVSEALCSRAKAVSEDARAVSSPFQQRAMEEGLVSGPFVAAYTSFP